MSFCSFSKEFNKNSSTEIDNKFISSYLPEATGDAVKVYLYGLFACLSDEDASIEKFAEELSFDKEKVVDCFRYWEEFGLVDIISEEPFMVKYLPIGSSSPKKYSLEKYGQFNKSLQVLISRMITANEYAAYFSVMEDYS
ncbi:MAG: hypothetical protein IJS67_04280, partial [Clostridia bacterium]|nr:hypothetical protein [Clostridia bacterium]